jgi:hypothetical protein
MRDFPSGHHTDSRQRLCLGRLGVPGTCHSAHRCARCQVCRAQPRCGGMGAVNSSKVWPISRYAISNRQIRSYGGSLWPRSTMLSQCVLTTHSDAADSPWIKYCRADHALVSPGGGSFQGSVGAQLLARSYPRSSCCGRTPSRRWITNRSTNTTLPSWKPSPGFGNECHEMHQPDVAGVAARREQPLLLVALQAPVTRAADVSVFCHLRSRDRRSTYPTVPPSLRRRSRSYRQCEVVAPDGLRLPSSLRSR